MTSRAAPILIAQEAARSDLSGDSPIYIMNPFCVSIVKVANHRGMGP